MGKTVHVHDFRKRDASLYDYRKIDSIGEGAVSLYAPAKLNITLSIGEKGKGGMHEISSVMQTISLSDHVLFSLVRKGCSDVRYHLPAEDGQGWKPAAISNDTVSNALRQLSRLVGRDLPCIVDIFKLIPMAAGMGGGSSDASAALRAADHVFGLKLGPGRLQKIAERIGNDVSFLLYGGRSAVNGGKKHTILQMPDPGLYYAIASPRVKLSTRKMYALHDKTKKGFTELASELCPETAELLGIVKNSAEEAGVTGKGPTVFGGYKDISKCEEAALEMSALLRGKGEVFIETGTGAFIY